MMNHPARTGQYLCAAMLLTSLPHLLRAQQTLTNGSITGRVLDSTGAALPQTTVTALQAATNQSYSVHTDIQGRFRLLYLPIGDYQITTQAPGFADAIREVNLSPGSAFDLTLQLSVAGTRSSIQVTDQSPIVELDRSQIGETVQEAEVQNLPFEGRNYLDVALLLPGVSPTNTASTQTLAETSEVVGQGYSVNSQRNFSNSFIVDGLSGNDDAAGLAGTVLGMDVVREFQVVTSGGQAEFGRALGGYFNIVTRSGANDVHGTGYGFLRNQRMNADNALSGTKLPLTQGQYGASLSGPVVRDRSFFFGNFEEQRLRTDGIITVTPANATPINARLSALGYAAPFLPVSNSTTSIYPTTLHTDSLFLRGDHRVSGNDRLEARYSLYQLSSLNARGIGSLNEVSNGTSVYDTNHTFAASNIATLTPHIYNETRGQFIYDNLYAPPNDQLGPAVTISGVAVFGRSTSSPTRRLNYLAELANNFVVEHGAHTFKAGVDFLYNSDTITYPQSLRGSYNFACLYTDASQAPANYTGAYCTNSFYSGTYNSQGFTQNFGTPVVHQTNPNIGFYAQDEWKLSPSLTLNAGVRYDLEYLETITTDKNNVSPRIGIAWSPFADRRTVVRGSYGLFYDRAPLRPLANALLSAHNTTDYSQAALLSYTFSPGQVGAPSFPAIAAAPPAGALENFSLMQRNIQSPYSQQASLGVEQQIFARSSLEVSYQHLRGEHLIGAINTNINSDGMRPDPTRGNVKPYSSVFDSYFDGLEVSFVQRTAGWGSARVSYTWSHAIDNVSEFFFSAPINNFNLREDRSRADDDQRHRVVFDAALNTSVKPADSVADHVTHGWKFDGVLQYYSALPFNITTGSTTKQGTTQRPCLGSYSLSGTNPCTEGLAGAVIGRNAGIGFPFFTLNARLSRSFALTEHVQLETLAEAFNSLNHRNDMVPNSTWGTGSYPSFASSTFGQATAVGDPRSVQFGARVNF